jgi:hypothetical protein
MGLVRCGRCTCCMYFICDHRRLLVCMCVLPSSNVFVRIHVHELAHTCTSVHVSVFVCVCVFFP